MDPDGVVRLLSAILWELPSLPGAACIGRHELSAREIQARLQCTLAYPTDAKSVDQLRISSTGP